MGWFLDRGNVQHEGWVNRWLEETFREYNDSLGARRRDREEINEQITEGFPVAHYLNVLNLFARPNTP